MTPNIVRTVVKSSTDIPWSHPDNILEMPQTVRAIVMPISLIMGTASRLPEENITT